jgi:endoglucanase
MHILEEELYQAGMATAACPTATGREGHVRACVMEKLQGLPNVTTRVDEFGNLHAIYEHKAKRRQPFRVVAHMDHPAFVVDRSGPQPELQFAGGVDEKYFVGKRIVFHNEKTRDKIGKAMITGTAFSGEIKPVTIDTEIPRDATFAVWDLPAARCTKELFVSPACDDLAQVSTVVALLRKLAATSASACVHGLFTRAEEVGFAGALAALKSRTPLEPIPTISLETSQARGFAKVDAGPVLRIGDRLSIFDSRTTLWLEAAFRDLQAARPGASFQRLLMGGGTCEASVFHRAGLPTGALCVALNNYHNMGPGTAIRSESISLRDWQGLHDYLFHLATEAKSLQEADDAVTERLNKLEARALKLLAG